MPYIGRLEERPLLDVIQIIAYSQQSGILSVEGAESRGAIVFENGSVVCAVSPSTLRLLVRAAKQTDDNARSMCGIQILTALRELFDATSGDYRFEGKESPVPELEGLSLEGFYRAGAFDTGDLLLMLEKAMENARVRFASTPTPPPGEDGSEQRRHPRYGPVTIRGTLSVSRKLFPGHLMNVSLGGTFFRAETLPELDQEGVLDFELPWKLGPCAARFRVVWLTAEGPETFRGAGLRFDSLVGDSRSNLDAYIRQFEELVGQIGVEANEKKEM
ncbi:MAG TPA: DUF4388 domain-containing protein [Vicinamibacteria bacterium]|nr:DUF4388 domain-containing protein [Vicinamibacteria bacterium]